MIEKINSYKTSDGILFENYIEAKIHEDAFQKYIKSHPIVIPKLKEYLTACGKYIDCYTSKYTINEIIASSYMCIPSCNGTYLWYNVHEKKVYAGCTKNLNQRVRTFVGNGEYTAGEIDNIRKSYPKEETWILFIIDFNIDDSDLLYKETELMREYDTINPSYGYNDHFSVNGTKKNIKKKKKKKKKKLVREKQFKEKYAKELEFYNVKDDLGESIDIKWDKDFPKYFREIETDLTYNEFDLETFKNDLLENYNGYNFVWRNSDKIEHWNEEHSYEIIDDDENLLIVKCCDMIFVHVYFSFDFADDAKYSSPYYKRMDYDTV